ncbi:hypothetical protein Acor_39830 [Acrocarpospora corrugata]|uniref:Uncharacterized protein n=1 Tax=Acrocarpospora corrugata TaxID=35763 RepID=A0A5M3W5U2_9ACTN|nr:hypothetical protein Acor_39830 [Acrocarpospora corrugata]
MLPMESLTRMPAKITAMSVGARIKAVNRVGTRQFRSAKLLARSRFPAVFSVLTGPRKREVPLPHKRGQFDHKVTLVRGLTDTRDAIVTNW